MRRTSWLVVSAFVPLALSCSTHGKTVPIGGECFQASDCGDGVVCVPQTDGKRICSTDISGIVSAEDAAAPPVDAGASDGASDSAPRDAAKQPDGAPPDAEPPDTGAASDAPVD